MPTALRCENPIQGLVLRVTILDSCGAPVSGAGGGQIVWDGFTQVTPSPQYDTGDRKIARKANGTICVNRKSPDQFTHNELTIDLCGWNPGLVVATLGARLLSATDSPTGTGFAIGTWTNYEDVHWSLEVWQAPPEDCESESDLVWPYHAWPHITDGKLGAFNINEDPTVLQLLGNTLDASPLWVPGNPYLGSGQVVAGDHYLYNLSPVAPPESACVIADYAAP